MKILIEMDGPLVNVEPRYYAVHRQVMESLGLPKLDRAMFWRLVRRVAPTSELVLGGREKHFQAYKQAMIERLEADEVLELDEAQPEADGAMRALRSLGEPVLVTMRLNRPGGQAVLNRLGLSEFFLRLCGLSQSQQRRTDQLTELAGENRRVVVVAASEPVILAAREADLPVVGISNGPRTPQQLRRAGTDVVFTDLDAFAVALAGGSDEIRRAGVLPAGTA